MRPKYRHYIRELLYKWSEQMQHNIRNESEVLAISQNWSEPDKLPDLEMRSEMSLNVRSRVVMSIVGISTSSHPVRHPSFVLERADEGH